MLQKLAGHRFGMYARGHEIVAAIAQHANNFCSKSFVKNFYDCLTVGFVSFRYCTLLHMFARSLAQSFDVGKKWFIGHGLYSRLVSHGFLLLLISCFGG